MDAEFLLKLLIDPLEKRRVARIFAGMSANRRESATFE